MTHPRTYRPPTESAKAVDHVRAWMESPSLVMIGGSTGYFKVLARLISAGRVAGPQVHDARIAAICIDNGVSELLSCDRDFGRFPALKVRNPLIG